MIWNKVCRPGFVRDGAVKVDRQRSVINVSSAKVKTAGPNGN